MEYAPIRSGEDGLFLWVLEHLTSQSESGQKKDLSLHRYRNKSILENRQNSLRKGKIMGKKLEIAKAIGGRHWGFIN